MCWLAQKIRYLLAHYPQIPRYETDTVVFFFAVIATIGLMVTGTYEFLGIQHAGSGFALGAFLGILIFQAIHAGSIHADKKRLAETLPDFNPWRGGEYVGFALISYTFVLIALRGADLGEETPDILTYAAEGTLAILFGSSFYKLVVGHHPRVAHNRILFALCVLITIVQLWRVGVDTFDTVVLKFNEGLLYYATLAAYALHNRALEARSVPEKDGNYPGQWVAMIAACVLFGCWMTGLVLMRDIPGSLYATLAGTAGILVAASVGRHKIIDARRNNNAPNESD